MVSVHLSTSATEKPPSSLSAFLISKGSLLRVRLNLFIAQFTFTRLSTVPFQSGIEKLSISLLARGSIFSVPASLPSHRDETRADGLLRVLLPSLARDTASELSSHHASAASGMFLLETPDIFRLTEVFCQVFFGNRRTASFALLIFPLGKTLCTFVLSSAFGVGGAGTLPFTGVAPPSISAFLVDARDVRTRNDLAICSSLSLLSGSSCPFVSNVLPSVPSYSGKAASRAPIRSFSRRSLSSRSTSFALRSISSRSLRRSSSRARFSSARI
mmetsp:Transcript_677/g.2043  ORF Transcript_677/g.2043 Transcript_677/m.2043 type:complete len:272 (-) Transcript_677:1194-2009(-)